MKYILPILILSLFASCKPNASSNTIELDADMHTYSNYKEVYTTHLNWKASIDFVRRQIKGSATWHFVNKDKKPYIHFDTYDLSIQKVFVNNKEVQFFTTPFHKDYGSGVSVPIGDEDSIVRFEYNTGPQAIALQWLTPQQTAGKKLPYLFTQCESIYTRSLMPCQDVPAIRITYDAAVQVPKGMMAIMSADNPTERSADGNYAFKMDIPIPPYLIALAAGDISYKAIDARSGVYTEPSMLDAATEELSDIPNMMKTAESLAGPYRWGKYDVLIAPPSFPIGGMENPKLTFATPTIITGDKSLVSLIAHEMAHSWSGNLVTNASWDDIWLNEGYTTYLERRIMEKTYGKEYTEMLWELGYQDMQSDLKDMGITSKNTQLKVNLKGEHPGSGFTNIPYEKGAIFLRMLEENIGRERFDSYMDLYFKTNAFIPMTTEKCLAFMDEHLFAKGSDERKKCLVDEWVYKPGLPSNCPKINPLRFKQVDEQRQQFENGFPANQIKANAWTTHEWLQFIRKLSRPLAIEKMNDLDNTFHFTQTKNSEIADEWFKLAINSSYNNAFPSMQSFLHKVGRKKFLEPLYSEMMKNEESKKMAIAIFKESYQNYHPQTAAKIKAILQPSAK
jgi:leukotriene-A4 hydrolase